MNDLDARVRVLEQAVAAHVAECRERTLRMDQHFERNQADHQHINVHLDSIESDMKEVKQLASGTAGKVAVLIVGSSAVMVLILEGIRYLAAQSS